MPTKEGKTYSSFYKNGPQIRQTSNTGIDSTTRILEDGAGQSTSISLSDDVLSVQPVNDNTTGTMLVKNQGGSNILAVNTTDSKVLVGASQVAANTFYQRFSVVNHAPSATVHYPMGLAATDFASLGLSEDNILGTGTDPATTLDISAATSESNAWVHYYWYLPDNITLDSAIALSGGTSATDTGINFHIMSYTLDTSSSHGDLSSGVVVADSDVTSGVDEDVIKTTSLTIQSADIDAGKVLLATFESDTTQTISSQMIVKYHIR
tara:strand:- start:50 stop:844 length:795 start_codon:yes stop_codon:yes gene_type:complete